MFEREVRTIAEMDATIKYYTEFDPHQRVAEAKLAFFRKALDNLADRKDVRGCSLLDVGCGFGYFLEAAAQQGWRCFGVEVAKDAVRIARKRIGDETVYEGTLTDAEYRDDLFDAVTMWDVLFMVDDPLTELEECRRIMKRDGKIGIRVRNADFQEMLYKAYKPLRALGSRFGVRNPYVFHRFCYTRKAVVSLLNRAGFTNIRVSNSPLTAGDPYSYLRVAAIAGLIKRACGVTSNILFRLSKERWITSPSILVWAEKP
jgi:ubiquinone/menaquinone biosynthesis C-methylase UbiE